jgi:hypothetical protein
VQEAKCATGKKDVVSFAPHEGAATFTVAGIWTAFKATRSLRVILTTPRYGMRAERKIKRPPDPDRRGRLIGHFVRNRT